MNTMRTGSIALLLALAAGVASGHPTKSHRLMGTVDKVQETHFTVVMEDGHRLEVQTTADTRYERDGKPARRADLVAGTRVVVQLDESDKTAVTIKLGPAPTG